MNKIDCELNEPFVNIILQLENPCRGTTSSICKKEDSMSDETS